MATPRRVSTKAAQLNGLRLSFCESSVASSRSRWHLRRLTALGLKLGGGIDTESACGLVKPPYGWDLDVPLTDFNLEINACRGCVALLAPALERAAKANGRKAVRAAVAKTLGRAQGPVGKTPVGGPSRYLMWQGKRDD